ncbi:response regulator [bacterium]|nr:response regulator [bacterium]
MIPQSLKILLVEDDDVDAEGVKRGFAKANIGAPIFRATNGFQAIEVLNDPAGPFADAPYIVLLDLKMPKMNGIEFLEAIRRDENLRNSIVFVLTTSNDSQDRVAAYANCVAGYITKSKAGVEFRDLIQMLESYTKIVELPICR